VDGRKLDDRASAWSLATFSTDGKLVGVSDDGGTRVYRASDGRLLRMFPAPFSTGQFAFSLAISATGLVAMGRVGGLDIHDLGRHAEPLKYYCAGVCGPVSALAFSPNGAWLAYQAARGAREPTPGLVNVVDLREHALVAELEASSTRAGVIFAADGRTLIAANVTRVDDGGTFGLRGWNGGAEWRRVRDERGAQVPLGSIGPFAFDERVAAYSFDGRLELRELTNSALVWSMPLVPPSLDAVVDAAPMRLELVAFAPRSDLVLTYESPDGGAAPGTLVFRRMSDGTTVAMYDVAGVSALAIAPDGGSFVYSTGAGRTYTAVARVPR
jgi:drug/metabolite transporter superfamily protein YnfA